MLSTQSNWFQNNTRSKKVETMQEIHNDMCIIIPVSLCFKLKKPHIHPLDVSDVYFKETATILYHLET